ncbi:MAG: DMT family transporter [Sinobacteraceae bacterium]|nr:DMT family transporter [Nevskiaceae bacterium]
MQTVSIVLALLVGAGLVVQVSLNMALARSFGSAPAAALVNFLVGTVALTLFLFVLRQPWPERAQWESVPAWAWFGGLFGALYVATATFAGPRLGALLLLALTVAGQMVASIIVDHYGLLGFREQAVTASRLFGVLLLGVSIYLIAR